MNFIVWTDQFFRRWQIDRIEWKYEIFRLLFSPGTVRPVNEILLKITFVAQSFSILICI
jgi:hypothetical protein